MSRKTKLIVVLILAVLASDIALVAMSLNAARDSMATAQRDRLRALRDGFDIAIYGAETKLTEIAAFVAQIDEVKSALRQARVALDRAGGDPRDPAVDHWRRTLAEIIGQRWTRLQFHYLLRQFGFYLPPDLTAFYRAEAPHRFGEASDRDHSLVAAAALSRRPATGFDVDGLTTGLRAAVPIEPDESLGVIEVGTSLDSLLIPICPTSHCGVAVLLDKPQTAARMNPADLDAVFTADRQIGDWLVESSTNPAVTRGLLGVSQDGFAAQPDGAFIQVGVRWYAVASFPLTDHRGKNDALRPAVGRVLIWLDIDPAIKAQERAQATAVTTAVAAFMIIAILIVVLADVATARLEEEIGRRTLEVQKLLKEVTFLAERDALTGLYNRRVFNRRMQEETARARRRGDSFALIYIDLDLFKRINDQHGHATGDAALCRMGAVLRETVRAEDIPARVGGEEFAVILPNTDAPGAAIFALRLKDALRMAPVLTTSGEEIAITFSAGVTCWREGAEEDRLLREADRALYQAKTQGRNRTIIYDDLLADA